MCRYFRHEIPNKIENKSSCKKMYVFANNECDVQCKPGYRYNDSKPYCNERGR